MLKWSLSSLTKSRVSLESRESLMQFTKFRSRIAMEQWKIFGKHTRDLKKGNACSNHIDNLLDAITSKEYIYVNIL